MKLEIKEISNSLNKSYSVQTTFLNDRNNLNCEFYYELLHIIGLYETKDNTRRIKRLKEIERNEGSLLENVFSTIQTHNILPRIKNLPDFQNQADLGDEEQIFNIGLELCIIWINRILFLKLLESQLVKYIKKSQRSINSEHLKDYLFLNVSKIKDFGDLKELFFEILAVKPEERQTSLQNKYKNIPYLNSSLFELTTLEKETVKINHLNQHSRLPIYNSTVLKDEQGKRKTGSLPFLHYLFEFLDSYNFASDHTLKIQEQNKTIIHSSVLGLIFEKINGYKEGSFFSPGYITMYICRETLRNAILQKFRASSLPDFQQLTDFKDLYNQIGKIPLKQANEIFNSIRICDPAVGSGHFLVSALNELIALKSELGILCDNHEQILRNTYCEVQNDELFITYFGQLFVYDFWDKESQRIQETIFHEKRILIENCLFGVDINPKSVQICRLRLWIELLKNAYYKNPTTIENPSDVMQLETLPNIDINIKCGNSLISRFSLDGSVKTTMSPQKMQLATNKYKKSVNEYKNAITKSQKQQAEKAIQELKNEISRYANPTDKDYLEIGRITAEIDSQKIFFSEEEKTQWDIKINRLTNELREAQQRYDQKSRSIYGNAFEWRFEFPEVLDDKGYFVGFDAIIGNPPYFLEDKPIFKEHYIKNYKSVKFKINLFTLFIEKIFSIASNTGIASMIVPNLIFANDSQSKIRELMLQKSSILLLVNLGDGVFNNVAMPTMIFSLTKNKQANNEIRIYPNVSNELDFSNVFFTKQDIFLRNYNFVFDTINPLSYSIIHKIERDSETLETYLDINQGIITGDDKKLISTSLMNENFKPIIRGKDIGKYLLQNPNLFVEYNKKKLACARSEDLFNGSEKLLLRRTGDSPVVCYDNQQFYNLHTLYSCRLKNETLHIKYILALLNSKLMKFVYQQKLGTELNRTFAEIKILYIRKLPLKVIHLNDQIKIVKLVDKILEIKNDKPEASIEIIENQIDNEVYKIYDLDNEEISLIEMATGNKQSIL
jgi:hypothetical protein